MHILIAPDSFKESLSAFEVAKAIQKGLQNALPQASFDLLPVGDGGEGTLDALVDGLGLERATAQVSDAFGHPILAHYAKKDDLAIFEMADICGLEKIPQNQRNPLTLSTRGVGDMIVHLAQSGIKKIMVGVGGSSTNDGGIGMAAGLGYQFFDSSKQEVEPLGENLGKIASVSKDQLKINLDDLSISIITDVKNYLCGNSGATYVFAAQKGLAEEKFAEVDQMMMTFYEMMNPALLNLAGAGAGGGMAAGLVHFAQGQISPGIDTVLDLLDFDRRAQVADLIIVGEGRMDAQSLSGKAPIGVARRAKTTPVIAICGSLKDDLPQFPFENIIAAFPIIASLDSLEHVLAQAESNLERTAQNIGNLLAMP